MTGSDLTLATWLTSRAELTPDRVAIEFQHESISYRDLRDGAARRVAQLTAMGVSPGARVATLARNCPAQVEVLFACAMRRWIMAPLNWRLAPGELGYQLSDSGASVLLVGPGLEDHARAAAALAQPSPPLAPMATDAPGPRVQTGPLLPVARDDDPLLLIYTSGTTGRPKGAVLTHANCFWTNLSLDRTAGIDERDVVLQVLPQCHVGGWNVQPLLAWWKGARVVLEEGFDAGRVLQLIARQRVTTMMGVPTMYQMLAQHQGFGRANLSSLRQVVVGGAPMPTTILEVWLNRGVTVLQGYGLTEAAPNVLCVPAEYARTKVGSAGKPYLHVEVKLGELAPSSRGPVPREGDLNTGELLVRGPNVFSGYWGNPTATAAAVRETWLHTGDIAERDPDGFYWIRGRIKEMYISGGENVYPAEIEGVLAGHRDVLESAVLGVPDDRWGESGVAFLVPRGGVDLDPAEVRSFLFARLAHFKVPREIRMVASLPRASEGGKVLRQALLETWLAEHAPAAGPQPNAASGAPRV